MPTVHPRACTQQNAPVRVDLRTRTRPPSLPFSSRFSASPDKWPRETLAMGACVGVLDAAAAEHLGLHEGVRLIQVELAASICRAAF
eukprot:6174243-Pleurochrysis_carterae.AAC.5